MSAPTVVQSVERRLLSLYRLRDVVRVQYDARCRALHGCIVGRRMGREEIRAECEERRRLLRLLDDEIAIGERLRDRYALATRGARCPLAELVASLDPTTPGGPD